MKISGLAEPLCVLRPRADPRGACSLFTPSETVKTTKTRILLADDHALLRAGIRALLEKQDDMQVIGEAADGHEAVHQVAELRPDLVLMDIAMPGMDGIEATKDIKSRHTEVQILALTMIEDEHTSFRSSRRRIGVHCQGRLPDELLCHPDGRRGQRLSLLFFGEDLLTSLAATRFRAARTRLPWAWPTGNTTCCDCLPRGAPSKRLPRCSISATARSIATAKA